jgi:hypothetical protein
LRKILQMLFFDMKLLYSLRTCKIRAYAVSGMSLSKIAYKDGFRVKEFVGIFK